MNHWCMVGIVIMGLIMGGCWSVKTSDVSPETELTNNTAAADNTGKTDWQDTIVKAAGGMFLGAEYGALFYAFDDYHLSPELSPN